MPARYYMLIASLPYLPHFLRAERLPINPQRLRWRRSILEPADAADLDLALGLLQRPGELAASSDAQIDQQFRGAMKGIRDDTLRRLLDELMGQRCLLAALRRKAKRLPAPGEGDLCGVGRWDSLIRSRYEREDFGLAVVYPWLPKARALLAQGGAMELEKLLMESNWRKASQVADADPFGFPAVFAYLVKWDILSRWLSRSAEQAAARFKQLVDEVVLEQ